MEIFEVIGQLRKSFIDAEVKSLIPSGESYRPKMKQEGDKVFLFCMCRDGSRLGVVPELEIALSSEPHKRSNELKMIGGAIGDHLKRVLDEKKREASSSNISVLLKELFEVILIGFAAAGYSWSVWHMNWGALQNWQTFLVLWSGAFIGYVLWSWINEPETPVAATVETPAPATSSEKSAENPVQTPTAEPKTDEPKAPGDK